MTRKAHQDDLEMNQLAEAELLRLQRQYRIMEGDRISYNDEMKFYLEKQRKVIFALENEKENLTTNLRISKSMRNEVVDNVQSQRLSILLARQEELDERIKTEKSQLMELESQICKVEREVLDLRKKDISDAQLWEKAVESNHCTELLENRLNVTTVKLNKMLAGNTHLREEIDHLLKERTHFNQLYEQLVGRLAFGKKAMLDLIEQATLAYDQREEAQAKLQALKERDRADLLLHSQEMRELQRQYDHDSKLQDFLGVKGQKRIMADLEAKEALKKQQQKEATEELIATYNSILDQIKTFSGETDVDRLAARFLKQEEENFTLFNYVNELNNELEILHEQTNELILSVDEQRNINKEKSAQQQETISSLTSDLQRKEADVKNALQKKEISNNILINILMGIQEFFIEARCDTLSVLHLLGEEPIVSTFNVMVFLRIIGRQISDLLSTAYVTDSEMTREKSAANSKSSDEKDQKNRTPSNKAYSPLMSPA